MADSPEIDYTAVLADLKAKRDRLDAAIAGIESMLGLKATLTSSSTVTANLTAGAPSADLGPGAFLGMKIVDATVKLLTARRQAMRTDDIVTELKRGGIAFSTDSPVNTVGSVLHREYKGGGEVVSVGRGVWGLAEWHPRLRKRKANGTPVSGTAGEASERPTDEVDAPPMASALPWLAHDFRP